MRSWSKTLLVCVGVLALYGVQACTAGVPEADLNPQPLPPATGSEDPRSPQDESTGADNKNGGGGSSGGTMASPTPSADAGTEGGDAADGGDR